MLQRLKFIYFSVLSIFLGLKVTMVSFFRKSVTLQYPSEKQPMKKNFRGMVDLIPPDCVICYQCIKICPTAALELAHKNVVVEEKKAKEITKFTFNAELCCFCGFCEEICPTDAIYLNNMYEVSTYAHEDLVRIDLMDDFKYKHVKKDYQVAPNYKIEKPVPPPAPKVEAKVETKVEAKIEPQVQVEEKKPTT